MVIAAARILDANANRAREALRTMEDVARFALDDAMRSRQCKSLRHELQRALSQLPPGWLEANRDTPGDVGTTITTPTEASRTGLADVVTAAGKRLTESLRVMEETCKTFNPQLAASFESLRYRAYTAESQLSAQLGRLATPQWRLCVLLTESLCAVHWRDVVASAVENGADCIQVREKQLDDDALVRRVEQVLALAEPAGASVIVNDRVDIALAAGADGVHLGQHDLSISHARQLAGRSLRIGVSTHNLDEAAAAVRDGADYCGVGAMFKTTLKPDRSPSGEAYLRAFVERYSSMPHLAIGGITLENINQLISAGARGVAVSSAVCGAEEPGAVVRGLLAAFDSNYASEKSYDAV